jgi:hypothetical protein
MVVRKGFISFIFLTKNPHRNRWGFFIFQLLVSPGYPPLTWVSTVTILSGKRVYDTFIGEGKIQTKFESETSGELV